MPKSSLPESGRNDTPGAQLPDEPESQPILTFMEELGSVFSDANIDYDDRLSSSSCNGLIQSNGVGLLMNNEGEFILITPFGLIQGVSHICDDAFWADVQRDLEKYLKRFAEVQEIKPEVLRRFSDCGDGITGFWIISLDGLIICKQPRLLTTSENRPALDLEELWEKVVRE